MDRRVPDTVIGMRARTLRILLMAAAVSVVLSWLFDVVDMGFRVGPAVIAAVLVGLAVVGIIVTVRRQRRSRREPGVPEREPTRARSEGHG